MPSLSRDALAIAGQDAAKQCPVLCRFLDAGDTHTRGGPASKKRQGAKSRGAGQRLDGERYGDFRLAAHSMEAGQWGDATCMPACLHLAAGERAKEASRAGFEGGQRAPGALIAVNRVERDRRPRGAGATEREGGGADSAGPGRTDPVDDTLSFWAQALESAVGGASALILLRRGLRPEWRAQSFVLAAMTDWVCVEIATRTPK